jgi:uncharacterized protein (DUF1697 family)
LTTFVALLRGINVGGNNRLPMRDLAAILEAEGAADVRTYIQSGNAVFEAELSGPADVTARSFAVRVTESIRERHRFAPHVLVLPAAAVRRIIDRNPYPEAVGAPTTLHVFFLDSEPASPDHVLLAKATLPGERYSVDGAACYLHVPDGLGRSKLALKLEKGLGVPATARNWNTVLKLAELARV